MGPLWQRFRVFFPSWRFFDRLGATPRLEYRRLNRPGDDRWIDALPPPNRRALTEIVFNPQGNLRLAANSLLEQLLQAIEDTPGEENVAQSEPYALVTRLVRWCLVRAGAQPGEQFQFRLIAGQEPQEEEILVSATHEV